MNEEAKNLAMKVLNEIIDDMGKLVAQKLAKEEPMAPEVEGGMEVEIEAKPLDAEEAQAKVKDMIGGSEEVEEATLPRWKKRMKMEG